MKHNWKKLADDLRLIAPFKSEYEIARVLGISRGTVHNAFKRGDLSKDLLEGWVDIPKSGSEKMSFKESGNEATLKYENGEPLTIAEALKMANVDPDVWEVTHQEIGMWQGGVKSERKDLTFDEGKISGTVKSDGKLSKTYLYRMSISLTRKKRVAVKPVLKPLNFSILTPSKPVDRDSDGLKILFIADPHFGFRRVMGDLIPIHSRKFLNSLLSIADFTKPNIVIWNGDVLDLAEFGRFDTEPELLANTQLAGIELGWVLGQFRQTCKRQIIIEGNHEVRLEKAIVKNLTAGYQLTPIHDLGGHPLLSVPRFLGLDSLDTEWIGGYPSANIKIGSAKFQHGNVVRKGSAKTIGAIINDATGDRFFGHIHRYEIAQKYVEDEGRAIWVGSPGCACDKLYTPGSDENHNWQLGAFLITLNQFDGTVQNVEHISAQPNGPAFFRGQKFQPANYMREFGDSLPLQFAKQFGL